MMTASRLLSAVLACATAAAATASITGVTGTTTWLGANPPSAQAFNLTGPNAYVWDEQAGVLTSGVNVNIAANGFFTGNAPFVSSVSGTFDSHMIHFDPAANPTVASGSVTFSGAIAGVIYDETFLSFTDGPFGSPTTLYDTGNPMRSFNGSILGGCSISVAGNTLTYNILPFQGQINRMFEIRVLTAVPAPGGAVFAGLAGLLAARRRAR